MEGKVKIVNALTGEIISESSNQIIADETYLKALVYTPRYVLEKIRLVILEAGQEVNLDFNITSKLHANNELHLKVRLPLAVEQPWVNKDIIRLELLRKELEGVSEVFAVNTAFITPPATSLVIQANQVLDINWIIKFFLL